MADSQFKDPEKKGDGGLDMGRTVTVGEGTARRTSMSDAVFGQISEDGPNYRSV